MNCVVNDKNHIYLHRRISMKPGMEIGNTATISAVVTPDMYAQFEGKLVHPAYSTVSMVYHMEWAARQIILPYLEEHEEGIGGGVEAKHIAPTSAGMEIIVTATLRAFKGKAVICDVDVKNEKGLVGTGEVTQYILPKEEIARKLEMTRS
jgi:fluoroacetyl-CoA thioesterase